MRVLLILFVGTLAALNSNSQFSKSPFSLEVKIEGAKDGEIMRLATTYKDTTDLYLENDSVEIKNGKVFF